MTAPIFSSHNAWSKWQSLLKTSLDAPRLAWRNGQPGPATIWQLRKKHHEMARGFIAVNGGMDALKKKGLWVEAATSLDRPWRSATQTFGKIQTRLAVLEKKPSRKWDIPRRGEATSDDEARKYLDLRLADAIIAKVQGEQAMRRSIPKSQLHSYQSILAEKIKAVEILALHLQTNSRRATEVPARVNEARLRAFRNQPPRGVIFADYNACMPGILAVQSAMRHSLQTPGAYHQQVLLPFK